MQLFMSSATQWVVLVGMGGVHYQGLDYSKVRAVADWMGLTPGKELLWQLRVLEDEARGVLNG
ncbi:MAG: DUF1799 domain-containing protein [Ramlibacter sp.]|nr:DUF1799 domain-containing protein [Ramlibacter sp.]